MAQNDETTQASSTNKPEGGGACLHRTVSHAEAQTDGPVPDGRVRPTERYISRGSLEHGQRKTAKKDQAPHWQMEIYSTCTVLALRVEQSSSTTAIITTANPSGQLDDHPLCLRRQSDLRLRPSLLAHRGPLLLLQGRQLLGSGTAR